MKTIFFKILPFLFVAAVCFAGCKKNDVKRKDNLIKNPSFNSGLKHWTDTHDEDLSGFSHDTPKGGGVRSLELKPGNSQSPNFSIGTVETYITGESGTNTYELKAWMKCFNEYGTIYLRVKSQNQDTIIYSGDRVSDWTMLTITQALTIVPNDTIVVGLSATASPMKNGSEKVLFDLITLEKI